jgi:hypothetical protein
MPGVCVTPEDVIPQCNRGIDVIYPPDVSCVMFFNDQKCEGEKLTSSHKEEMKNHLAVSKSFMPCRS